MTWARTARAGRDQFVSRGWNAEEGRGGERPIMRRQGAGGPHPRGALPQGGPDEGDTGTAPMRLLHVATAADGGQGKGTRDPGQAPENRRPDDSPGCTAGARRGPRGGGAGERITRPGIPGHVTWARTAKSREGPIYIPRAERGGRTGGGQACPGRQTICPRSQSHVRALRGRRSPCWQQRTRRRPRGRRRGAAGSGARVATWPGAVPRLGMSGVRPRRSVGRIRAGVEAATDESSSSAASVPG